MIEIETHLVTPEESSFIRGITYIPEQDADVRNEKLMEVRVQHDDHGEMPYYYENVPISLYQRFTHADSYGKFYHENIRHGSHDRDYTESLENHEDDVADLLYNVPTTISGHIKNQYKEFYDSNTELVDMLSNRRLDKSVLYVKDNPKFIGFTVEILYLMISKIREKLQVEHNSELSEQCTEKIDTYLREMKEYITIHNV